MAQPIVAAKLHIQKASAPHLRFMQRLLSMSGSMSSITITVLRFVGEQQPLCMSDATAETSSCPVMLCHKSSTKLSIVNTIAISCWRGNAAPASMHFHAIRLHTSRSCNAAAARQQLSAHLGHICNLGLIMIPGSPAGKPAIIVDAAMQALGYVELLEQSAMTPNLQQAAVAISASACHQTLSACAHSGA